MLSLMQFLELSRSFSRHLSFAPSPAQRFLLGCVYLLSFCSGLTFRYKRFVLSVYTVCSLNIRFVVFGVCSVPMLWFVPDLLALIYHSTSGCLLSSFAWTLFATLCFLFQSVQWFPPLYLVFFWHNSLLCLITLCLFYINFCLWNKFFLCPVAHTPRLWILWPCFCCLKVLCTSYEKLSLCVKRKVVALLLFP